MPWNNKVKKKKVTEHVFCRKIMHRLTPMYAYLHFKMGTPHPQNINN